MGCSPVVDSRVRRALRGTIGLVVALACATAPLPARAAPATQGIVFVDPEARGHFERGMQEFEAGRYHDAILALDAAYVIEQHPMLLYARAQARRLAGECGSALKLYEYFLATSPPEAAARDATVNIERCKAAVSTGAPPPEAEPEPTPAPLPEGPAPAPVAPLPPPARKDIAGGVLTGVGSVMTGAGLGMMLAAAARSTALTSHSQFDQRYPQLRGVYVGGAVVLGLGVGLLVGGITRYAVLAHKRRQLARAR